MSYSKKNKKNFSRSKATIGSYLVGFYLFSVPAFSYTDEMGLNIIPQILGVTVLFYAVIDLLTTKRLNLPNEIKLYGFFVLFMVLWLFFRLCVGTGIVVTCRALAVHP